MISYQLGSTRLVVNFSITSYPTRSCEMLLLVVSSSSCRKFSLISSTVCYSVPIITWGSFWGQRGKNRGSFRGRYHFPGSIWGSFRGRYHFQGRFGDHFAGCTVSINMKRHFRDQSHTDCDVKRLKTLINALLHGASRSQLNFKHDAKSC